MPTARILRHHLAELVVVFVGVALAFAVENLREGMNERAVEGQYLSGFRRDLTADLAMLREQQEARRTQVDNALVVLEFYDGRPVDPQPFFAAYFSALFALRTAPSPNTLDEVLSSGSLRLIRDSDIRDALLDLYAVYDEIARDEDHIDRDFDSYLYDPTFSSIPFRPDGPWDDNAENRQSVETILRDLRVENGIRLIVANVAHPGTGLLDELTAARSKVESLLALIPPE
jgi:hypothetical protein